jgi:hypothetical protein
MYYSSRLLLLLLLLLLLFLGRIQWATYEARGSVGPLRRPYTPLATSAQAALAPYQTTGQDESADTTFMPM